MTLNEEQLRFFYNEVLGLMGWNEEDEASDIDPLQFVRDEVDGLRRRIRRMRAKNVQLTYKMDRARAVVDAANEIHNLVGNRFDGKWADLAAALYAARGL